MTGLRGGLVWLVLALALAIPLIAATQSPLLQWREPIYIIAGLSGVIALALVLVQPLLIIGILPGVSGPRVHIWTGASLVLAVIVHVAGLWITSPPDVVDVLLFRSPAPFSAWGAVAMWAVFITAILAVLRKRLGVRGWRLAHSSMMIVIVIGTVVHAWLIQGTMEDITKGILCLMAVAASTWALVHRRVWRMLR